MTTNYQMGEENLLALRKELGPLGDGIFYLWNALAPAGQNGIKLTGWCLAVFPYDGLSISDLFFLKTEGYYSSYLEDHPPKERDPNSLRLHHFVPSGLDVKSRDSDARFMVLECEPGFSWHQMLDYAKWWNGYKVSGKEEQYYKALIKEGKAEQQRRLQAKKEEANSEVNEGKKFRRELREKNPEEYRRVFPTHAFKRDLREKDPEAYRSMFPVEAQQKEMRDLRKKSPEDFKMFYPQEYLERLTRKHVDNGGVSSEDDDSDY
ncbi:hypothetical protein AbraIFM66950_011506 [Aspergillus brasiliensis]|nr:hypothetical protein AbraIFM66950_011506 [Aspergillus brasiliensis]